MDIPANYVGMPRKRPAFPGDASPVTKVKDFA